MRSLANIREMLGSACVRWCALSDHGLMLLRGMAKRVKGICGFMCPARLRAGCVVDAWTCAYICVSMRCQALLRMLTEVAWLFWSPCPLSTPLMIA